MRPGLDPTYQNPMGDTDTVELGSLNTANTDSKWFNRYFSVVHSYKIRNNSEFKICIWFIECTDEAVSLKPLANLDSKINRVCEDLKSFPWDSDLQPLHQCLLPTALPIYATKSGVQSKIGWVSIWYNLITGLTTRLWVWNELQPNLFFLFELVLCREAKMLDGSGLGDLRQNRVGPSRIG